MENRQIQQMKELDTLFEKYVVVFSVSLVFNLILNYYRLLVHNNSYFFIFRETKTMKETQAKTSVETAREVNNDKSLKSKAEKERILREKNSNMTK